MCFSATASFTTAALTGAIGLITVTRIGSWKELPLASVPILFAVQQTIEGSLWLVLESSANVSVSAPLTYLYLLIAEVFWPFFVPIAVLLAEPSDHSRRLLSPAVVVGAATATYLLSVLLGRSHEAIILGGHIVYATEHPVPLTIGIPYLMATALPPLLSSQRTLMVLGLIVLVGCITAYLYYWQAFASTWCFFAAAASGILLFHFVRLRTGRLAESPRPRGT